MFDVSSSESDDTEVKEQSVLKHGPEMVRNLFCNFVVWGATGLSSGTNENLFVFAFTWCDTQTP